jgi:light-independent protochlorophyllide reductase subunit B
VISAPLHVQDVPARYAPQMGWEGANVIFDSWVHPLMMGLEEHLIGMFRHDFEFVDGHRSHLGDGAPAMAGPAEPVAASAPAAVPGPPAGGTTTAGAAVREALESLWTADGEAELAKIPFFVRGKVRKNTEAFARERGLERIDAEALYDAKAHFSR